MARKAVFARVGRLALIAFLASNLAQSMGMAASLGSPQAESVCLNELLPRPACASQARGINKTASFSEFIELYNSGSKSVDLSGWTLQVSPGGSEVIASGTQIPAGGHWVSPGLALPDRNGTVRLLDKNGVLINQYSYSSSQCARSIGRYPDGGSWRDDLLPTPGRANTLPSPSLTPAPSPTCTRTPTRSPTSTSTPRPNNTPAPSSTACPTRDPRISACISEFLPAPGPVMDWDGDGEANYRDEWIELHNASAMNLDLCGWKLDDRADGGARPYVFPAGSMLLAGQYRAYYLRDTGVALNNTGGDNVRLLAPDGVVVDSVSYEQTTCDVSYSRTDGCVGGWTTALPPSPGQANMTVTPTTASGLLYLPLIQRPRS